MRIFFEIVQVANRVQIWVFILLRQELPSPPSVAPRAGVSGLALTPDRGFSPGQVSLKGHFRSL